ncbi:MAG: hypothetical protein ACLFPE_09810 [Bacteroidales bacterium]
MKKIFFLLGIIALISCKNQPSGNDEAAQHQHATDSTERTNNFYDNEEVFRLKQFPLEVTGEIENPGSVDLASLPLRTIIVKEAELDGEGNKFIGAYRYNGYSLFDILNNRLLDKANKDAFAPIIDLFVVVENEGGEQAIFSWGEIYYPNYLHGILIATEVMRIVPSKTKELWPLPENAKLVVNHDLITARNLEKPVKITVVSAPREFRVNKGMSPMYAEQIDIFSGEEQIRTIETPPAGIPDITYETIFYGRGRGIHSTTPFTGQMLKNLLEGHIDYSSENLRTGYMIVAARDGYRGVYSYSEIFNRNDQSEVLLIFDPENRDGGRFRLFPACDFFSDRAIKSVSGIYFENYK